MCFVFFYFFLFSTEIRRKRENSANFSNLVFFRQGTIWARKLKLVTLVLSFNSLVTSFYDLMFLNNQKCPQKIEIFESTGRPVRERTE